MEKNGVTVFVCNRGAEKTVAIRLDVKPATLEFFKSMSKEKPGYTAKQCMENILNNYAGGVNVKN